MRRDVRRRTWSYDVVRHRTITYDVVRRKYVLCMRGRSNRTRAKYRRHSHYARHRVMSYVQKCAEIEHVSISAFHDVLRRTTSRVVWMPPILCTCSIRTTTYDIVRGRTMSYAVWTPLKNYVEEAHLSQTTYSRNLTLSMTFSFLMRMLVILPSCKILLN